MICPYCCSNNVRELTWDEKNELVREYGQSSDYICEDCEHLFDKEMYDQDKNTKRKDLHKIVNTANVNYILKREPNLTKTLENITDTIIGYFKRGDNITFETYGCEITFKFK